MHATRTLDTYLSKHCQGRKLSVHGRIYNIENGILKDLETCVTSIANEK